ncbi:hypothetical protein [Paenibacillus sp. Marseille-Q4541]|uniref:hypothetical protein n=1 Tax=Paenibacillus sp. Marseille-Q4541 TaxID=2831522 RepID=UPI001BAC7BBE|nr:hypothetical protein [Paenibacillus sp. Marseille-Q4541]
MKKITFIWTILGSVFLIILFAVLIGKEYDNQQHNDGKTFPSYYNRTSYGLQASTYYTDSVLNRAGTLSQDDARELFLGYTRLIDTADQVRQLRYHVSGEELRTEALENKLKKLGAELLLQSSKILEGTGDRREIKQTRNLINELQEQIPGLPSDTNFKDFPKEQKREIIHLLNRISLQLEKGQGEIE